MSDLIDFVLNRLERGEAPTAASLARLGDPEALEAVEAFRCAAELPELAPSLRQWGPKALLSAHPGRSAARLAEWVVERRAGPGELAAADLPVAAALFGSGNPFADWLRERPEWGRGLCEAADGTSAPPQPVGSQILATLHRETLRIAGRWLLGEPLTETLRAASELADICLSAAVDCATRDTGAAPPAVLAWGRYGAREPGLLAPLEVLLIDRDGPAGSSAERAEECALWAGRLLEELPQRFEAGLTFRFGHSDGPEGRAAAAHCVESRPLAVARWRSAKGPIDHAPLGCLRGVAGDRQAAATIADALRKLLERHASEPVPGSHRRVAFEVGDPFAPDEALDTSRCALGALERTVRSLALRFGLAEAIGTIDLLRLLENERQELALHVRGAAQAWTWLRRVELALGVLGAGDARIPRDAQGQIALARTMGYADPDATRALARFLYDWRAVRDEVEEFALRVRHDWQA